MVQLALLVALSQDVLLYGALGHQPVNMHLPRLADAVTPVLGLQKRPPSYSEASFGILLVWLLTASTPSGTFVVVCSVNMCCRWLTILASTKNDNTTPWQKAQTCTIGSSLNKDGYERHFLCLSFLRHRVGF